MSASQQGPDSLLERDRELEHARAALGRAAQGAGEVLLVEGPAGIGKTRLAEAIAEIAASTGFDVQWARGDELEQGFAYGVLRQLLRSMLGHLDPSERAAVLEGPGSLAIGMLEESDRRGDGEARGDVLTVDYGFYRLLHDLADQRPRLLCVDDAHWADLRSLHALRFATRRLEGLPVVTVVTYRRPEDLGRADLLGRLTTSSRATRLVLSPLGDRSVSMLAKLALRHDPDTGFCRHLSHITGGNPFLVREMLAATRAGAAASPLPDPADLERLVPERIVQSTQRRIATMGETATRLAAAVAVIGEAPIRDVARLASLDEADAVTAADRLAAAGVLSDGPVLRFAHPVVRHAVTVHIPPAQRALAHARAARLLAEVGAPLAQVAAHLLPALARADEWVVDTLLAAAEREQRRGSPETAVPLLARAIDEPPPREQRFDVTLALAKAQAQIRHPDAITTGHRVLDLAASPHQATAARLQLARTLGVSGDFRSGMDLLGAQVPAGDVLDPDLALQAEAELLGVARLDRVSHQEALVRLDALAPRATPARPSSVVLLANLALSALERNHPPSQVAHLAELALSQGWLIGEGSFQLVYAVTTLIWVDRFEVAERACDAAVDAARQTGSVSLSSLAHALRSQLNLRRGLVFDAAADARIYSDLMLAEDPSDRTPYARAHLANVLLERGERDEAERALADPHPRERAGDNPFYLDSRGRCCLARGDPAAAVENLLACGRALAHRGGVDTPTMFPWRSQAAQALVQLNDHQRARQLAEEELALATKGGVPGAIGETLITLGLIEGGDDGLDRLGGALDVLEDSPRVLTRIRALIELGAMTRRSGQPTQARRPVTSALDLAHHHGAIALAQRAREELIVAGGRPRRAASTGLDALTPSEHRVAQLVGRGLTNRQVADALFVSPRTVATHLTHIYQKLDLANRDALISLVGHHP